MGSFADYLENAVLNHVFGAAEYTPPANLYIGLSTTTITDAGGNITEPSAGAYARIVVANNTTNFPTTSSGSKANGADLVFPAATASWGTITDFFISDAATDGNIYGYGALNASVAIASGDIAKFTAGQLTITLT